MSIVNVKEAALRALGELIQSQVPELQELLCDEQADPGHHLMLPSLAIIPIRWVYNPCNAEEGHEPSPDTLVMDVGWHEGPVQLILTCETAGQRAELEQKIVNMFLGEELSPGVRVVTVDTIPELGTFYASFDYDEDAWEEGDKFEGRSQSIMRLTGSVPALTTRQDAHPMNTVQTGVLESADDVEIEDNEFPSGTEVVEVAEDGSITPA